jgi:hypothetical protein
MSTLFDFRLAVIPAHRSCYPLMIATPPIGGYSRLSTRVPIILIHSSVDTVNKSSSIPSKTRLCTQIFKRGEQDDVIPIDHLSGDALRMAVLKTFVWSSSSTLRFRFMTENQELEANVSSDSTPVQRSRTSLSSKSPRHLDATFRFDSILITICRLHIHPPPGHPTHPATNGHHCHLNLPSHHYRHHHTL